MRRLAVIAMLLCGAVMPGRTQSRSADGVVTLLNRFEKVLLTSDAAQIQSLLSPDATPEIASEFAPTAFMAATSRAVIKERERSALSGRTGYRVIVEILTEDAASARLVTASLDVVPVSSPATPDEWRLSSATIITTVEGLHRLTVNATRQFAARGFVITSEDLTLTLSDGAVFTIDSVRGTTGLVFLGHGQMKFAPAPQTERDQIRLLAGADTLAVPFDVLYVRLHPDDFPKVGTALMPVPVDSRQLQRAREVFASEAQRAFSLDLGDLTREPWYLIPTQGDFLAEIRTRGKGNLTYARSLADAEDVTLLERAKGRDIARYASAAKLRIRGKSFDEDDIVPYNIVDYDIDAVVDPDRAIIEATATLKVVVQDDGISTMNVRLAQPLVVTSIASPELGRLMHVRIRAHDTIVLNLPFALRQGARFSIVMKYSGRIGSQSIEQEGLTQDDPLRPPAPQRELEFTDAIAPEEYYLLSSRAFWYPQGVFSGYATATLRVIVPSSYGCAASGEPAEGFPRPVAGASPPKREFVFRAREPVRYLALVVARFRSSAKDEVTLERGRVQLNTEIAPRLAGRGRELSSWAADIVRTYSTLLDDAPYPTLSLAVVEHVTPGGHSPGHVVVLHHLPPATAPPRRDDPATFAGFPEFFLAHEIAHQWWGQAVGWENYHEQWLSEGFAQYFAALYAQRRYGDERFVAMLKNFRRWAIDESDQGPVYLGYRLGQIKGDRRVFRAIVYNKGAAVLHMLRRLTGDEMFFAALRRFYRDQKFTKAGTEDLRFAFEEETGLSLERFFERWIYQSRIPRLRATFIIGARDVTVTIRQSEDEIFDVPVTVTVVYADGRMQDVLVPVTRAQVEQVIPTDAPVRAVRFNRDNAALAEFDE
jgi:hypothetical protein